jgi:serine/threonine-protein kinase
VTQDVYSGAGDLAPGDRLAGYLIQDRIGRGGMAVVYRALDLRLGRIVALKVLAPRLGEDHAFRQRFIRESRAAAGVDHPHIVPVFEAGEAAGMLFIVMRYVDHGDIRRLIEAQGWLSPLRAAAITTQVASALDAAHVRGLVHRDVKPGNMLLARAGDGSDHVYLSDFGLSKQSVNTSTLTAAGQFLGTLDYVSPEQIQGNHVDGRADQYALACTVVEMLTGRPPFHRDDTMQLMWAQLEEPPPSLTERRPDLPPAVDQVVAAALAKSPAGRYPTCAAFAASLSAAAGVSRAAALQDPRPPRTTGSFPSQYSGADGRDRQAPPRHQRQLAAQPEFSGQPAFSGGQASSGQRPFAADSPGSYDDFYESASPARGGRTGPMRGRPGRSRKRSRLLAGLTVVLGLLAIGVICYKIFDHAPAAAAPETSTSVQAGPQLAPAATVRAYFTAINRHRYAAAWRISGEQESLGTFTAGFAGTKHDDIKILGTKGHVVTARLVATQTDGTVKTFRGTYTVTGGKIVKTDVEQVS